MNTSHKDILLNKRSDLIKTFFLNNETEFIEDHTFLLDEYFSKIIENSSLANNLINAGYPFAIIALGGYGRKEQCIHSDIDLLILFNNKVPSIIKPLIQELIYPLWDAKFEVGYAIRDIKECILMAFKRFDILTAILDARFICGDLKIYNFLMKKFKIQLSTNHLKTTLKYLLENGKKRHKDFGDSTYLIEPNLKSGFGGLRDYHSLLWYAKIQFPIKKRKDLKHYGLLSDFEYQSLKTSLKDIWKTRNYLHHKTKRKCDTLYFEYQIELASQLGYQLNSGQPDVEKFLKNLHERMEFLKFVSYIAFEDMRNRSYLKKNLDLSSKPIKNNGLIIKNKRLYFVSMLAVVKDPNLLLKIFLKSGQKKIHLSIEARRIINDFLHLADHKMVRKNENIKIFKKIMALSYWEFNVLNLMLLTGILEKFIPEFSAIVNRIQYNQYHLFPIDKHCVQCVQQVNSFKKSNNSFMGKFYSSVYKKIENKSVLLFAALLHDIGKAPKEKDHSAAGVKIAEPILKRFGFKLSQIKDALFLIKNHLLFVKTATRRDVQDEETIFYLAGNIKKKNLLRLLYLLSIADAKATGPKAWNSWIESLFKELFLKTMSALSETKLLFWKNKTFIDKKKDQILKLFHTKIQKDNANKLFQSMSSRYLIHNSVQDIKEHISLFENLKDKDVMWKINKDNKQNIRKVCICGKDQLGFYAKIAGVFFLNGLNIISSQAYSFSKNHVLDIFTLEAPKDKIFEEDKWRKTKIDLDCAINDDCFLDNIEKKLPSNIHIPISKSSKKSIIRFDNKISNFFNVIEVFTYDFPGLLFLITYALYKSCARINAAIIATKVDLVVDVFYISDATTYEKILDIKKLEQIKNNILKSLPKSTLRRA